MKALNKAGAQAIQHQQQQIQQRVHEPIKHEEPLLIQEDSGISNLDLMQQVQLGFQVINTDKY